jgi:hypothetical protein
MVSSCVVQKVPKIFLPGTNQMVSWTYMNSYIENASCWRNFRICRFTKILLTFQYSACKPTTHNTQHRTTKMDRCHPTLLRFRPHSPWVGQRRPQILAPRLPMGPLQVPGTGFVHVTADSRVWDEFLIHIKK